MFKNAIVRRPGRSLADGITSASLGKPNYENALKQHDNYITALERCDVTVTVLDAQEKYPDSVFVEDTAVLTAKCAVITNPGALSRQGEEHTIHEALKKFYTDIHIITSPGTIEGGDVMMVGDHFYAGLSARTNKTGTAQFAEFLSRYGYTQSDVEMAEFLHLKTGLSYLENNNLLIAGEFIGSTYFKQYNCIEVTEAENYSANSIWVNGTVLVPTGYAGTLSAVKAAGYKTIEVDVSEFRKLDGGLSCLSLRF